MENLNKIRYFNIDWSSKNDGKGVRTVIFLQGCNLKCPWCHSPHSQPYTSPILFNKQNCIQCKKCVSICQQNVHSFKSDTHYINIDACTSCGQCIEHCNQSQNIYHNSLNALNLPTTEITPEKLFNKVLPQLSLLSNAGGVTISGGEPMLQHKALIQFLKLCKSKSIPTTIETSASVPFSYFSDIHKYVDDWLFGLRPVNNTYAKNSADFNLVTNNLNKLSRYTKSITIRVPLIKGVTDSSEQIHTIINIMHKNRLTYAELLPFNPYTDHYYKAMGIELSLKGERSLSNKNINKICNQLNKAHIKTKVLKI